jgi:hypothetical protein
MKSDLDPVFWMSIYSEKHVSWTGRASDPLFMLKNGRPLDRKTLVTWVRQMAQRTGHPRAEKINGISFRRGGAQALRSFGYKFEEFGVLGRWITARAAARYVTLTDPVVDEFADAFDTLASRMG